MTDDLDRHMEEHRGRWPRDPDAGRIVQTEYRYFHAGHRIVIEWDHQMCVYRVRVRFNVGGAITERIWHLVSGRKFGTLTEAKRHGMRLAKGATPAAKGST